MKPSLIIKILSVLLLFLSLFSINMFWTKREMKQKVILFYALTLEQNNLLFSVYYDKDTISALGSKQYVDLCKFVFKKNSKSLETYTKVATYLSKESQIRLNETLLEMASLKQNILKDMDLYPSKLNLPPSTMNDVKLLLSKSLEFDSLLSNELSKKTLTLMEEIKNMI